MRTLVSSQPLVAPRRVLTLAWLSALAVSLYVAMVAVVLPQVAAGLRMGFSSATWLQVAFLLTLTVVLVPAGRISDRGDRWATFRFGVATFLVGSLVAAGAPTGTWLLVATAVQGAGAAFIWATNMPLITTAYPESSRGRSLGIYVVSISIGRALGPVIGGVVVTHAGWRAIFLVITPLLVAVLVASPRGEGRIELGDVSLRDVAQLGISLAALLIALTFAPIWGWRAPASIAAAVLGSAGLAGFATAQWRAPDPLLDLRLFARNRLLLVGNTSIFFAHVATFGIMLLTAVHLQLVAGWSVQAAATILLAHPVAMTVVAPVAGRLSDSIGSRALTTGGLLVAAAGIVALSVIPPSAAVARVAVPLALVGAGLSAFLTPNTSAILGAVLPQDRGVASATLATVRSLGQATSVAVLAAVAATQMGSDGTRVIFLDNELHGAASGFATGFQMAMRVAAVVALAGAVITSARGRHAPMASTGG